MSHYPYQPSNARFSGEWNRRSEYNTAPPRRSREENTKSRIGFSSGRRTELANHSTLPVATPAFLVEQVCVVDKDLNNVPDKISAIAEVIQNGRTPQIQRLLEDAVVRASSNISKTAKIDPLAPTQDWQHYAERLLTAHKEALGRDLAT